MPFVLDGSILKMGFSHLHFNLGENGTIKAIILKISGATVKISVLLPSSKNMHITMIYFYLLSHFLMVLTRSYKATSKCKVGLNCWRPTR